MAPRQPKPAGSTRWGSLGLGLGLALGCTGPLVGPGVLAVLSPPSAPRSPSACAGDDQHCAAAPQHPKGPDDGSGDTGAPKTQMPDDPAAATSPLTPQPTSPAPTAPDYACPNDADDPHAGARKACIGAINAYRATQGLAGLARWCAKTACLDEEGQNDGRQKRAHATFGACGESAQNACPDWRLPLDEQILACLKTMWEEGPGADFSAHGHYLNMSNSTFTQVECGFWVEGDTFWAVQDFH